MAHFPVGGGSSGSGITALTGDVTAVGPGSAAATLADTANVAAVVAAANKTSALYIPGIVADATAPGGTGTDNYATLVAYVAAFLVTNPNGGVLPQRLPIGFIGLSRTYVPPAGVKIPGAGRSEYVGGAPPLGGSTLVPLAGFTGSQVIQFTNPDSGLIDANVYCGTAISSAVQYNGYRTQVTNVGYFGPGATAGVAIVDATANAKTVTQFNVYQTLAGNEDTLTTYGLNVMGSDWISVGCRFEGTKVMQGIGNLWSGCHFTYGSNTAPNIIDQGGQNYAGCYFDSTSKNANVALFQNVSTGQSSTIVGGTWCQNADGTVTGIPMISETTATAGLQILGGNAQGPAGASTFTSLIDHPTANTQVFGLKIQGAFATSLYTNGSPGHSVGVTVSGTAQADIPNAALASPVVFTASGANVWTPSTTGQAIFRALIVGGGAGGVTASATVGGGGGGGGEVLDDYYLGNVSGPQTVTIGAGGAHDANGTATSVTGPSAGTVTAAGGLTGAVGTGGIGGDTSQVAASGVGLSGSGGGTGAAATKGRNGGPGYGRLGAGGGAGGGVNTGGGTGGASAGGTGGGGVTSAGGGGGGGMGGNGAAGVGTTGGLGGTAPANSGAGGGGGGAGATPGVGGSGASGYVVIYQVA